MSAQHEPRRAPTREEFIATLNRFRDLESDGDVILNNAIVEVDLIKAFDALAAERDAALKEVLPVQPDPRIAAWRALDAEERDETLSAMRINGYDAIEDKHDAAASRIGRASLIAAAALEALGEK